MKSNEVVEARREVVELGKRVPDALCVPWSRAVTPKLKPIESDSQYTVLARSIVHLRHLYKEVKARLDARVKPLQEVVKLVREDYNPLLKNVESHIDERTQLCDTWDKTQRVALVKVVEKLAKQAERKGAPELAADLRAHAERAPATPAVDGVQERVQLTYDVVDFAKVPDEYKQLDKSKTWKAIQAGVSIPGIIVGERKIVY